MVPPFAQELHRRAKRAELVMIPGGSHMLPIPHTKDLTERIGAGEG
jgi:hypothetical protein